MHSRALFPCLLLFALVGCRATAPDYTRLLPEGAPPLLPLDAGEQPPSLVRTWSERTDVGPALERSLAWMRTEGARHSYPAAGIGYERALASLERFQELLRTTSSGREFDRAVQREFQFFKSAGWDGRGGGVLFTGYCTPILRGSARPDSVYRYPLFALPPDLLKGPDGTILGQRTASGTQPYPTRREIEEGRLLEGRGLELVWLADPIDAFIAHVNGSAFIELEGGGSLRLGYAGKNGRPYVSLGGELVQAGVLKGDEVSLATIRSWARENPHDVARFLLRNDSYVFFTPIEGYPRGSLNVEVQAERTLATDKTLFPRAALVFVDTALPGERGGRSPFRKLLFDQDTGGAIRTAGRADIYLGIGPDAERRAGATQSEGQMYYLFLREGGTP